MVVGSVLKLIAVVVVLVVIIGLLFGTETGRKVWDILKMGGEKIISGLSSLLKLSSGKGESLQMILSANEESFYGKKFEIENSTFNTKGTCVEIKINNAVVDVLECEINLFDGKGTFEYLNKSIRVSLSVSGAVINGLPFKESQIEFKIMPTEFLFDAIEEDEISIFVAGGELKLLNSDGTTKCIIPLKDKTTKISDFSGSLRLKDNLVYLSGTAFFEEGICLE
jgi:hypothetical protein